MANGMILTAAGRELLTLALAGKNIHFTRGAVGDGNIDADTDTLALTELLSERRSLPIQSISTSRTGTCEVVLSITNTGQPQGFWLREYGLFAQHPDTGREILYAYCNKGTEAGYLEGYDGSNPITFGLTLITIIDQAQNVTATVTAENNYVTVTRLEGRIYDLFANSKDIAGVWIYGADSEGRLSPISWQQFKLALTGVTDIEALNTRIEQLEDNQAEMLLNMEMREMYPNYTHYLIEDFRDPDQIDQFTCNVTSVVAGDNSIDCDAIDGIYPGSWYTIADGINLENIQIRSVSIANGIYRLMLEGSIENTYNVENCRMYRTNAGLITNGATGSGVRKAMFWRPDFQWSGYEANSMQVTSIDMSAGNSRAYTLSGYCAITGTGALTLAM